MVEHVLAALAGLWIDNCRIQLDAPEPPVGDGSSLEIVEAILHAGISSQSAPRRRVFVHEGFAVSQAGERGQVRATRESHWVIQYDLDYGDTVIRRGVLGKVNVDIRVFQVRGGEWVFAHDVIQIR